MVTEPEPDWDPQNQRLQHMASSMEDLNARIARLAIGLGVSLEDQADVARVMSRPPLTHAPLDRRMTQERRHPTRPGSGMERRIAHKREELRGLLVLRYRVEALYVDEIGVTATREILIQVEAHLQREGFRPGADGIDLKHLLIDD
jgi:hypothetical protein